MQEVNGLLPFSLCPADPLHKACHRFLIIPHFQFKSLINSSGNPSLHAGVRETRSGGKASTRLGCLFLSRSCAIKQKTTERRSKGKMIAHPITAPTFNFSIKCAF